MSDQFRAGFACVIGRPNTGKSTLVNALVGAKVAITSHHPNTTRNPIRAILTMAQAQIILVDTPGVHKPKTLLGTRLNAMVTENIEQVDAALLCLPADEAIGKGDEFIAATLGGIKHLYIAVTKVDLVSPATLMLKLTEVAEFLARMELVAKEIVPISATKLTQIDLLKELLITSLPKSPALYPAEVTLDQAVELTVAEFIREAAIEELYEELPHSVMITIEEYGMREDGKILEIQATLHVERDSQKGIIIGPCGSRLKSIGQRSRLQIESFLGEKVFLGLHVKVSKEWQRDPKALLRFGFSD
jgi:GTP-binding protein Era